MRREKVISAMITQLDKSSIRYSHSFTSSLGALFLESEFFTDYLFHEDSNEHRTSIEITELDIIDVISELIPVYASEFMGFEIRKVEYIIAEAILSLANDIELHDSYDEDEFVNSGNAEMIVDDILSDIRNRLHMQTSISLNNKLRNPRTLHRMAMNYVSTPNEKSRIFYGWMNPDMGLAKYLVIDDI